MLQDILTQHPYHFHQYPCCKSSPWDMDGRGVMAILAYTMGLNALALALPFSFELHKIFFVGRFRILF
jgi:hypothetical protein